MAGQPFASLENTIIILLSSPPEKNLLNHCEFQFLFGLRIAPRENDNNGYAIFFFGGGGREGGGGGGGLKYNYVIL